MRDESMPVLLLFIISVPAAPAAAAHHHLMHAHSLPLQMCNTEVTMGNILHQGAVMGSITRQHVRMLHQW
jgi:hypothetical protein